MKESLFTSQRTGRLEWVQEGYYYRFVPENLPFDLNISPQIDAQMYRTSHLLGKLDGLTKKFSEQEIRMLQAPLILKEAALSSMIEGTRSTITDIYKEEKVKEDDPELREDNEEVRNYREALNMALAASEPRYSQDFIKKIHAKLLQGVRGQNKTPGDYKSTQNAIGMRDDTLDEAKFVPAPPRLTENLMQNLVEYMNLENQNPLYKIAVTHYQFESIHPFLDGNGRLGRLLIMVQLCREGVLSLPLLYISGYFNRNRDTYIEKLFDASATGDIEGWILFFLKALEFQANATIHLLESLETYKEELHSHFAKISQSPNIHKIIDYLFRQPFFTVNDLVDWMENEITQPATWSLVQLLIRHNVAHEFPSRGRRKVYVATQVLSILEESTSSQHT